MYPKLVLLFTMGCVGVFGQLEMSTIVPKATPFNSTFKLDFGVETCKVISESAEKAFTVCGGSTEEAVCYTGKATTKLLELHVEDVPEAIDGIKFTGDSSTDEKKFTLSTKDTTDGNINLKDKKIDETGLNIGFIVTVAKLLTSKKEIIVDVVTGCDKNGPTNCLEDTPGGGFYINVDSATDRTIICNIKEDGQEPVKHELKPTGNSGSYHVKIATVAAGFTPSKCTVQAFDEEDNSKKMNLNQENV